MREELNKVKVLKEEKLIENIQSLNVNILKECLEYKGEQQKKLFELARNVRDSGQFGNKVEIRSVIEVSNICRQACKYCSIWKNKNNYVLTGQEILKRILYLAGFGRRTFLIQSGEYAEQTFIDDLCSCCSEALKIYPDLKFILCLGNLSKKQYKQLKNSGANRYILKFETGNSKHHEYCRPNDTLENRLGCIQTLIDLGFQVGTGNIVGLPGQTLEDLANDLVLTTKFDISMVSATKFITSENSEFKNEKSGDIDLTLNFIAILRILHPNCLIPTTSSLETKDKNGQLQGLLAGCNTVTIHDGTPKQNENKYQIYSKKRFTPSEQHCLNIIKSAEMVAQNYLI